ncbi:MAG: caspase family protein [Pseudomonadota bacterium]
MRFILATLTAFLFASLAQGEEKRLALLIGNADYPAEVGRLALPPQDVANLSGALRRVGFQVDARADLDEDGMQTALSDFERQISEEAARGHDVVAFFYYSGHGVSATLQGERKNFLLPARERITTVSELARNGIALEDVVNGLSLTPAGAVFVVADACRNDLQVAFGRSTSKGFAPVPARPGMFIAHSTYPGQTAPDDGAFAKTLAANIVKPGLFSERAFALTNREVAASRGLRQIPTTAGALNADFCFNGCPGEPAVAGTAPAVSPSQSPEERPSQVSTQPAPTLPTPSKPTLHAQPGMYRTDAIATMTMTPANGFPVTMPPQSQSSQDCTLPGETELDLNDLVAETGCQVLDSSIIDRNLTAELACIVEGMPVEGIFSLDLNEAGNYSEGFMELYGETPGVGSVEMRMDFASQRIGTC